MSRWVSFNLTYHNFVPKFFPLITSRRISCYKNDLSTSLETILVLKAHCPTCFRCFRWDGSRVDSLEMIHTPTLPVGKTPIKTMFFSWVFAILKGVLGYFIFCLFIPGCLVKQPLIESKEYHSGVESLCQTSKSLLRLHNGGRELVELFIKLYTA